MLPFYKMILNKDSKGMDFIALVDSPAHMKSFQHFNKNDRVKYHFNEEKRIVTGVAIAVGLPIYRNDNEIGEHYVVFEEKETLEIAQKMFKNNYLHNVNEMHNSNKNVKGMTLFESYFIDESKGKTVPDLFKNQNLKDGSWIVSYKVDNDQVWNDIKNGKHVGFSIEGWFDKENIKLKTKNTKMSKETKTLFERVFGAKNKFSEAESVDGVVLVWEGELAEGTELKVKTEEGEVLAPEGTHSITDEEGAITVITVDGNGIIVSVESGEVAEVEEEMTAEKIAEVISELRKEFKAEIKKVSDKNIELEKENQTFKTQIETLTTELDKDEKKKFVTEKGKNWKTLKK